MQREAMYMFSWWIEVILNTCWIFLYNWAYFSYRHVCMYVCVCVCMFRLSLLLGSWSWELSQDVSAYAGLLYIKADRHDFRLPMQCKWDTSSLGFVCNIEWYNSRLHKIPKGCTSQSWHAQGHDKRYICRLERRILFHKKLFFLYVFRNYG